jgi:hypothetical protein
MAEVYNPKEYRNYIHLLVKWIICMKETYDYLKDIIQGKKLPDGLSIFKKD